MLRYSGGGGGGGREEVKKSFLNKATVCVKVGTLGASDLSPLQTVKTYCCGSLKMPR